MKITHLKLDKYYKKYEVEETGIKLPDGSFEVKGDNLPEPSMNDRFHDETLEELDLEKPRREEENGQYVYFTYVSYVGRKYASRES